MIEDQDPELSDFGEMTVNVQVTETFINPSYLNPVRCCRGLGTLTSELMNFLELLPSSYSFCDIIWRWRY